MRHNETSVQVMSDLDVGPSFRHKPGSVRVARTEIASGPNKEILFDSIAVSGSGKEPLTVCAI